jgi:hypothetical protein
VAEQVKYKKVSLRDILEEIAEDEAFSDEERNKAHKEIMELEYKEWCTQQDKQGR